MLVFEQSGVNLDISFDQNEKITTKLSLRMFRRFKATIESYITEMLSFDKDFDTYYTNQMYHILKYKVPPSAEFIQKSKDFVSSWLKAVGKAKTYELTKTDVGALTQEQIDAIFYVSYLLKLLTPILYTTVLTTTQIQTCLFDILSPLHELNIDEFLYKFIQLKFSKRASQSFWKWLAANKFQTINFHILNLFYITLSVLLVQLQPAHNPITFLKVVIEKSIQWIITDVYTQEVKYSEAELKKIKYVKDYSLIHSQAITNTLRGLEDVVYNTFNVDVKLLAQYNFSATYKFIALPLLTKLFKTSYVYFYNYKNWGVCSYFTSLLLSRLAPPLTLLQNMCLCKQERDKKSLVRDLDKLSELYNYPSVYQNVFNQTKVFDFVIRELMAYTYIQVKGNLEQKVSSSVLIPEYVSFYKNLILSDHIDVIVESLRKTDFTESLKNPSIFTSFLKSVSFPH
ncbi:MAG: hypothetical protein QXV17_13505 [Candidatus Micrarchaeaceae archaeon]